MKISQLEQKAANPLDKEFFIKVTEEESIKARVTLFGLDAALLNKSQELMASFAENNDPEIINHFADLMHEGNAKVYVYLELENEDGSPFICSKENFAKLPFGLNYLLFDEGMRAVKRNPKA